MVTSRVGGRRACRGERLVQWPRLPPLPGDKLCGWPGGGRRGGGIGEARRRRYVRHGKESKVGRVLVRLQAG